MKFRILRRRFSSYHIFLVDFCQHYLLQFCNCIRFINGVRNTLYCFDGNWFSVTLTHEEFINISKTQTLTLMNSSIHKSVYINWQLLCAYKYSNLYKVPFLILFYLLFLFISLKITIVKQITVWWLKLLLNSHHRYQLVVKPK